MGSLTDIIRYEGDSVWDAAAAIQDGDAVRVIYDSKRSDMIKIMEGDVKNVDADGSLCEISFKRDDGQTVIAKSDGYLYSVGSHHPNNGKIEEIKVKA